ncbi:MAG: lyase family protein, partial [Proteobacteria bacterium]|nr:lyase family protein [Pseudomonadota bacterium]
MNNTPKSGVPAKNALWGGRFESGPGALMQEVNASIGFDKALAAQDLAGSRAHCTMLVTTGILDAADGNAILKGLDEIEGELARGEFAFSPALEDIHMHIEARLAELIGDA